MFLIIELVNECIDGFNWELKVVLRCVIGY